MKHAKTVVAVLLLIGAGVLFYSSLRGSDGLDGNLNFVCAETGERFNIPRDKVVRVPARHPKTGERTLLPVYVEDGQTRVSDHFRGAVEELGEVNHYVDPETLVVRSVE